MKTGQGLVDFAKTKLGIPYFYGAKMQPLTETFAQSMHKSYPSTVTSGYIEKARRKGMFGKICVDCSGLIGSYRGKQIGSSQLYATASKKLPISDIDKFYPGTVLWKSGHVGVYIGKENGILMCIEAKGIDYGVVKSKVSATKWSYGLLFDDLSYENENVVNSTTKEKNPYIEPSKNVKNGTKGMDARWVQWELCEAGYAHPFTYNGVSYKGVVVDGEFGKISTAALKHFQASCKNLVVDGICGPATRKALKNN
jgi:peptidoglycan hydrolase-like protein with peptidoglycan-binding domain